MNNIDKKYQELLQDILDNGTPKSDRTGTGTISVFGRQIRHNMKDGFPLLTTKKMPWKTIVTELLWFLRGDTNIKYLIENGCHIWTGDAKKRYDENYSKYWTAGNNSPKFANISTKEFEKRIINSDEFANKWGELGPIYGKQWRNWGGWTDTKQTGFLHKTDNGWTIKWSDLHSFANGTEWLTTPIQDSDQSLYSDEDEGKKVYYKNITLGYNESFCPVQVAKVIDDKFDKYIGGKDQIQNLINDLKTNPDSRRLMVNAWNVGELDQMVLPPCHYGFQVYTRELSWEERRELMSEDIARGRVLDKNGLNQGDFGDLSPFTEKMIHYWMNQFNIPTRAISLMWNQRSVDTFLGLPFNIASYGLLLEIIAKEVNMVPDELIGNLGDVHLYSNHIEQAKEQIGRKYTHEERTELLKQAMGEERYDKAVDELMPFGGGLSEYYDSHKIPYMTREPYELPRLKFSPCPITGIDMEYQSIAQFQIENYESHPVIKAPLSN
jgi:thymidylate synthase